MVHANRIAMQNTSTHQGTGPQSKSLRLVPSCVPTLKLQHSKLDSAKNEMFVNVTLSEIKKKDVHQLCYYHLYFNTKL